jgi:putative intracellular protease/amidase
MIKQRFFRYGISVFAAALFAGSAHAADAAANGAGQQSNGRILIVMTNHAHYPSRSDTTGLWLTELTHFYDVAQAAGLQMDFASPEGGAVPLDERSLKPFYLDDAARAHLADPAFMARLKATLPAKDIDPSKYQAIYYTGGHGTLWDFPDNKALENVGEQIYRHGGVVSAVCHGVSGLLPLQDASGNPLIAGRTVTGFSTLEESLSGIKPQVPFLLQNALVHDGAHYKKALFPFTSYVVTDDRIITGQNPESSQEIAEAVVKRLRETN